MNKKDNNKFFYKEVKYITDAAWKMRKNVIEFHNKQDYDEYIKTWKKIYKETVNKIDNTAKTIEKNIKDFYNDKNTQKKLKDWAEYIEKTAKQAWNFFDTLYKRVNDKENTEKVKKVVTKTYDSIDNLFNDIFDIHKKEDIRNIPHKSVVPSNKKDSIDDLKKLISEDKEKKEYSKKIELRWYIKDLLLEIKELENMKKDTDNVEILKRIDNSILDRKKELDNIKNR